MTGLFEERNVLVKMELDNKLLFHLYCNSCHSFELYLRVGAGISLVFE